LGFEHLVTLIIFVLPGYFAATVYGFFLIDRKSSSFEKTSLSVFFSLFIYSIFVFIPYFDVDFVQKILEKDIDRFFLVERDFLVNIWLLILFSFLTGFLAAKAISNRTVISWFSKALKRSYFKRVWDEAFYMNKPEWIYVKTTSGKEIIGKPYSVSDYPGDKELYLVDALMTNTIIQKGTPVNVKERINGEGILVNMNSIEYIIFIQ